MRPKLRAGLAVAVIALVPLAACRSGGRKAAQPVAGGPSVTATATALAGASAGGAAAGGTGGGTAGGRLAAAVARTRATSFTLTLGDESSHASGPYDPAKRIASFTGSENGDTATFTVTADQLYLGGLKELGGQTWRMQIARLKPTSGLTVFTDPLAGLDLLAAAKNVTSATPGRYVGVVDVSAVPAATAGVKAFVTAVTTAGGAAAKAVNVVATVDPQGYVTEFDARLPRLEGGKDLQYKATFAGFGKPVGVAVPTAGVVEAPAAAYAS